MDSSSLHQQIILQHSRHPRNHGVLEEPDAEATVQNPTCGDEITLQLRLSGGSIEAARFQGQGCSISQASASMMAQRLEGRSLPEAAALASRFRELVHGDEAAARDPALGDLRALAGVSRFPVRVRCALLPWDALRQVEEKLRGRDEAEEPHGSRAR